MRRVWKYRAALTFLLLAMLLGGAAAVSFSAMKITLALALAFMVGMIIGFACHVLIKKENGVGR